MVSTCVAHTFQSLEIASQAPYSVTDLSLYESSIWHSQKNYLPEKCVNRLAKRCEKSAGIQEIRRDFHD